MAYNLFLSSNTNTPFAVINDETFDTGSSSITFVGRNQQDYGAPQNQNFLWLLENFALSSAPSNPIRGQLWYDTAQSQLKVYNGSSFIKVSASSFGSSPPNSPSNGQLWFNSNTGKLNVWNGSQWIEISPSDTIPTSLVQQFSITRTTTNNTASELWVNGQTNSRMEINEDEMWSFDITLSAKRIDTGTEVSAWNIKGLIDSTGSNVTIPTTPAYTLIGQTNSWSVEVSADNSNNALVVTVTGQSGKTISWNGYARVVKAS